MLTKQKNQEQECIPVGCVPPTAVAISWGGLPQCMLGYTTLGVGLANPPPQVWAWRPSECGPGKTPQVWAWRPPMARPLKLSLGCGPGNLQGMLGYTPQRPARHAGIPHARHAGIPPLPVNRITDTCKNITFPQLCGR